MSKDDYFALCSVLHKQLSHRFLRIDIKERNRVIQDNGVTRRVQRNFGQEVHKRDCSLLSIAEDLVDRNSLCEGLGTEDDLPNRFAFLSARFDDQLKVGSPSGIAWW